MWDQLALKLCTATNIVYQTWWDAFTPHPPLCLSLSLIQCSGWGLGVTASTRNAVVCVLNYLHTVHSFPGLSVSLHSTWHTQRHRSEFNSWTHQSRKRKRRINRAEIQEQDLWGGFVFFMDTWMFLQNFEEITEWNQMWVTCLSLNICGFRFLLSSQLNKQITKDYIQITTVDSL